MSKIILVSFFILVAGSEPYAQTGIKNLGLEGKQVTSLKIWDNIIAVGTDRYGAYWQFLNDGSDTIWNHIDLPNTNIKTVYPHKSGPLGWAIGSGVNPNEGDSTFIYCSYMGEPFTSISSGIDSNAIEIFELDGFPDPTICGETFAVSYNKLYRRNFGDTIWFPVYEVVEGNLATVKAKEQFHYVFAGGGEGFAGTLLMRSSNAGDDWEHLFPMMYVSDIEFYGSEDQKIFVTDGFKILRSLNSGLSWEKIFETDSLRIEKISLTGDGEELIALGISLYYSLPRTFLFSTTDNGDSWNEFQLPIFDLVTGMELDYDNNVYVSSKSSGVFKIPSSLVNVKKNDFPPIQNFQLFQNYPNPFNPTTEIKFTIPSSVMLKLSDRQAGSFQHHEDETPKQVRGDNVNVQLAVYDILGNEIATLVNEQKPAGNYEVMFNGNGLSTGVYFYRLNIFKTKSERVFTTTKKMMLIK